MKKCFSLVMVVVLLFSLSACRLRQSSDQAVESSPYVSIMPTEVKPSGKAILQATPSPVKSNYAELLNEPFTVVTDTFTWADTAPDASIFIEYIQIEGLLDLEKKNCINNMLCQSVSSFTQDWEDNPEISNLKTYEINTEYTIIGDILCLREMISYYNSQAAHPWVASDAMT